MTTTPESPNPNELAKLAEDIDALASRAKALRYRCKKPGCVNAELHLYDLTTLLVEARDAAFIARDRLVDDRAELRRVAMNNATYEGRAQS